MENTLWDVVTSPGKTERMTLDQLDASFQAGAISEGTLVREPGTSDWRPLYEIAGLEPPAAPAPVNGAVAPNLQATVETVNAMPPVVTPAIAAAPAELASLKSTMNGAGSVHPAGPANGAALPNTFNNDAGASKAGAVKGVAAEGPFAPSPSITAPPSTETPSVRVPPPSKVPQVQASNPAEKPSFAARTPRTAPKTSKPPATAPRRTGPPTSRTARGVPLPSVVPKDDLVLPTAPAPGAGQPSAASPAVSATATSETGYNPKPLTPPKTGARRVSAPPAAVSASNGSRTRRAPPSILSATAPNAGLTPPPPPPVPVSPRSVPPPPSGMSLTHGHHPNPELAPWDVGGGGSHPPVPFNDNPLVGTPTPEQFAAPPAAVQVLPVPVAITPAEEPIPLSEPGGQRRLNAPPLPSNAFAHLAPEPQPMAPPFQPAFLAHSTPAPPMQQALAPLASPQFAPAAPANPASLYNALGFSNPPQEAAPFAVDSNPFAVRPVVVPARSGGVSWAEVTILALATLLSAFIVLQRNGLTREWFGPNSQSSYARLETTLFGQPDINTVAGVKALLKELSTEGGRTAHNTRKPTGGSHAAPKADE